MTENITPETVIETEEQRQEREYRERLDREQANRDAVAAYVPKVGDILWRVQPDPLYVAPEGVHRPHHKPSISVGYRVTRVTKTRVTTEDGTAFILHDDKSWRSNIESDGEDETGARTYRWHAYQFGRPYGGIWSYAKPTTEVAVLRADLDAKLKEEAEAKAEADTKARREKLEEVGLRQCILDIFAEGSYVRRSQLDALYRLLDEAQQKRFHDEVLEVALDATRQLLFVSESFERLGREASRLAEQYKKVS